MRVLNIYKNFVYHLIFFILFISCKGYNIIVQDSFNIKAQNNIEEYNFNEINLSNYRDSISSEMNQVINYSNINMNVGCPEGLLGNFITDLSILYLKKQININENKNIKYFLLLFIILTAIVSRILLFKSLQTAKHPVFVQTVLNVMSIFVVLILSTIILKKNVNYLIFTFGVILTFSGIYVVQKSLY